MKSARLPHATLTAPLLAAAILLGSGCGALDNGEAPTWATPAVQAQTDLQTPVPARADESDQPAELSLGERSAPTDPVATDIAGALLPPQDVTRLGWWVDSALPGSGAGTIVVTGHVDDAAQGDGFAKQFARLQEGDQVTLTSRNGQQLAYLVDSVTSVDKSNLPVDELNRLDGPERLALVTCGGEFVGPPLGYANNDIVFAYRIDS